MSKPQLIVQDIAGAHNANLVGSRARIIKGASWKKQRTVMIIPAGDSIPAQVALSLWNLIFPPNQGVYRILAQGMEVGEAYSTAVEQVLAHPQLKDFEYLVTAEHDNLWPSDGLLMLMEALEQHHEYAAISGLYWTKYEGGVPQIWGDPKDPLINFRPQPPDPGGGLVECNGIGMGAAIWRLKMFKDERLRRPWFKTVADKTGAGTQDLYFAADARKYGYRFAVHCGVRVGHMDTNGFIW